MIQLYTSLYTLAAFTADRVKREQKGATAVEYGLMVGLIAVAIIVTVGLLGGRLDTLFRNVLNALPGGAAPAAG
ncbi:Flp family type IVb pilin [Modestobacter marinus]|uniref:Flp family type IVb pilin n=1 Tax=Modestobacter marinus TaxID=477641 RepID=UPI0027E0982D|nr:Flp family type IVb pilin [Modestobacter marinus]